MSGMSTLVKPAPETPLASFHQVKTQQEVSCLRPWEGPHLTLLAP